MAREADTRRDPGWDNEEGSESQHVTGEVITLDEQLLERLEQLEHLLRTRQESPATKLPAVRRADDFSISVVDDVDSGPEEILIRVKEQLQNMPQESLQDDIGRALLSAIGASYGAQIGGPTGAGLGAAIASFLHSRKKVNPLEVLFGRRE